MKLEAPAVDRQKLHIRSQSSPTVGHSGRPEASRTGRSVEACEACETSRKSDGVRI
jgi:hypothetical protein